MYQDRRALRVIRSGFVWVSTGICTAPFIRLANPDALFVAALAASAAFLVAYVMLKAAIR